MLGGVHSQSVRDGEDKIIFPYRELKPGLQTGTLVTVLADPYPME
jgi:hypothetical protein